MPRVRTCAQPGEGRVKVFVAAREHWSQGQHVCHALILALNPLDPEIVGHVCVTKPPQSWRGDLLELLVEYADERSVVPLSKGLLVH